MSRILLSVLANTDCTLQSRCASWAEHILDLNALGEIISQKFKFSRKRVSTGLLQIISLGSGCYKKIAKLEAGLIF